MLSPKCFCSLGPISAVEWNHVQHVISVCATLFTPLQHTINSISVLFKGVVSEQELAPFSHPTHFRSLGVANCVDSASLLFQFSCESSALLTDAIVNQGAVSLANHFAYLNMVHAAVTRSHEDQYQLCFLLCCSVGFHTSGWLNVLPLIHHHFDLSAQQFRDTLCLHYHHLLSLMPTSCDGCADDFS